MMISILSPVVSTVGIWVSVVSMVGISKVVSVSMVGISVSVVSIGKRVSIVSVESISISLGLSSSGGLGISGPLAIVVSITGIWVSIVSMVGIAKGMSISIVTIEIASISRGISLASNGGEHAQGDNG